MSAIRILVDADACPVKDEIYKVAFRREVAVRVVSNAHLRVPAHPLVERVVVSDRFDAADDWIAEQAGPHDVVITADILLADRCLKKGAAVIANNGKPFTAASIGGAIATRAIMADLRAGGDVVGGLRRVDSVLAGHEREQIAKREAQAVEPSHPGVTILQPSLEAIAQHFAHVTAGSHLVEHLHCRAHLPR